MNAESTNDAKIVASYRTNAAPWTTAVRESQIESRRLVTDAAILSAIESRSPRSAIDLGCGEGWLCRAMAERGIHPIGVDATPELIEAARQAHPGGDYRVATFDAVAAEEFDANFDIAVANFALLGKEPVERLVAAMPRLLNDGGALIVQTLHPKVACCLGPYEDGWREGSWHGFDSAFTDPHPWYFRTVAGWERLFVESGLQVCDVRETCHPETGAFVSVVFVSEVPRR